MKEIDVMVEKWQSDDGKIFPSKDDCMIYEAGRGYVGRWFQNLSDPKRTEVWCIAGATTWYSMSEAGMEEVTDVRPAICQYGFGDADVWQEDLMTFQELDGLVVDGKIVEID